MSGFKLLAIRPLKGCDKNLSKNLVLGKIYKFYNEYEFYNKGGEIIVKDDEVMSIIPEFSVPRELYNITCNNGHKINVNISAIVGKNGSGKSTLLELIYAFCFVLAKNKKLFKKDDNVSIPEIKLGIEIWFVQDESYYELSYRGNNIIMKSISEKKAIVDYNHSDFFYNIVINYSHYSLNSRYATWLYNLFNKVDSYRIPIVLNPFREVGCIDINSEQHLAQSRLLLNIGPPVENSILFPGKAIESIVFELDLRPSNPSSQLDYNNNIYFREFESFIKIFNQISEKVVEFKIPQKDFKKIEAIYNEDGLKYFPYAFSNSNINGAHKNGDTIDYFYLKYQFIKYVINKLFKICENYKGSRYIKKINEIGNSNVQYSLELTNVNKLLREIKNDKSHVTLKLRQALNIVKYDLFINSKIFYRTDVDNLFKRYSLSINYAEYISLINVIESSSKSFIDRIEYVPGVLLKPSLRLKGEGSYHSLSSGELQLITTLNVIYYHIQNINSVFEGSQNENKIVYRNINIILDEIELYFHPDFQIIFIRNLLDGLKYLKIDKIDNINILFSTHSPFILSDIPSQNILRLSNGTIYSSSSNEKTFGANIHNLLANDFFMEGGFMGKLAQSKIEETITFLNYELCEKSLKVILSKAENKLKETEIEELRLKQEVLKKQIINLDKEYHKNVIEIIGEPIIKIKLQKMYSEVFDIYEKINAKEEILMLAQKAGIDIKFNN